MSQNPKSKHNLVAVRNLFATPPNVMLQREQRERERERERERVRERERES